MKMYECVFFKEIGELTEINRCLLYAKLNFSFGNVISIFFATIIFSRKERKEKVVCLNRDSQMLLMNIFDNGVVIHFVKSRKLKRSDNE